MKSAGLPEQVREFVEVRAVDPQAFCFGIGPVSAGSAPPWWTHVSARALASAALSRCLPLWLAGGQAGGLARSPAGWLPACPPPWLACRPASRPAGLRAGCLAGGKAKQSRVAWSVDWWVGWRGRKPRLPSWPAGRLARLWPTVSFVLLHGGSRRQLGRMPSRKGRLGREARLFSQRLVSWLARWFLGYGG